MLHFKEHEEQGYIKGVQCTIKVQYYLDDILVSIVKTDPEQNSKGKGLQERAVRQSQQRETDNQLKIVDMVSEFTLYKPH